jgi:hypothetical protein
VLNLTANGQVWSQHEYKQQQCDSTGKNKKKQQKQRKINQFRLLTLKQEFLKISVSLHTANTIETHLLNGSGYKIK